MTGPETQPVDPELLPPPHLWVKMRLPEETAQAGEQTYGWISWKPSTIPQAGLLEIDVAAVNRLLDTYHQKHPVSIVNFHPSQDQEIVWTAQASAEAIALEAIGAGKKAKLNSQTLLGRKLKIMIDFGATADAASQTSPLGKDDPDFSLKYARLVNQALVKELCLLPIANWDLEMTVGEKQQKFQNELLKVIISALAILPSTAGLYGIMLVSDGRITPEGIEYMIPTAILTPPLIYALGGLLAIDKNLSLSEKFYPYYTHQHLLFPLIAGLANKRKTYIRPCQS